MANRMGELERHTISQQSKVNEPVNQGNESSSPSRSDRSIQGMIDTSESGESSSELSTAQALIRSLQASITEAQRTRSPPQGQFGGRHGWRGGDGGRGRGPRRREHGVLGKFMVNVDRQLTRREDPNRTEKKFNNKLYCHTHGYECAEGHDSMHCMWPVKGHCKETMAQNPMGGCLLYKRLSHCPWWRGKRENISKTSIIQKNTYDS